MNDENAIHSTYPRIHCLTYRPLSNGHPYLSGSWKFPRAPTPTPNSSTNGDITPSTIPQHPLELHLSDKACLVEVRQQIVSTILKGSSRKSN